MLTQQLTGDPNNMSGQLVIRAAAGALAELQSLAAELKLRPNVQTDGNIEVAVPMPPPEQG
jgi:hypothetical protein